MTTAAPAPSAASPASPSPTTGGRRMWNEVEALLMPEAEKARNVVELIHRSVQRIPTRKRSAGSCRRTAGG